VVEEQAQQALFIQLEESKTIQVIPKYKCSDTKRINRFSSLV